MRIAAFLMMPMLMCVHEQKEETPGRLSYPSSQQDHCPCVCLCELCVAAAVILIRDEILFCCLLAAYTQPCLSVFCVPFSRCTYALPVHSIPLTTIVSLLSHPLLSCLSLLSQERTDNAIRGQHAMNDQAHASPPLHLIG